MTLGQSIDTVRAILGRGCTPETRRRYHIEHTALMDVWQGNQFDDSRWNVTEAYIYREAWLRGQDQMRIEGKGEITSNVGELK